MTGTELDAAGITDPDLRGAYERCRQLNARHGHTYFLATRLLPPARRPAIHALYGFARWVDDIVDDSPDGDIDRAAELDLLNGMLEDGFARGHSHHPVVWALVDTASRYGIERAPFTAFMTSMRQDLTVGDYPDRAALDRYVRGSAEAIGLQVLPVLGTCVERPRAAPYAAALGNAFQLTNFLRDVGEDLRRGRVYLPADELAAFGVDRERLQWCARTGRPDLAVRRALADQVARTRAVYRRAAPGIRMLDPVSRSCVSTAYTLYGEILDRVVESDYDVFAHRVSVSRSRRCGVAMAAAVGATRARTRARLGGSGTRKLSGSMLGGR